MNTSDKYPDESGRRRFVKGVVGAAALSGLGVATVGGAELATPTAGGGGGETIYFGIENVEGPAPRAMPQIPINVDEEGYLKGIYPDLKTVERQGRTVSVPEEEIAGVTYAASWFQYCGVQNYEGVSPEYDGDDYFRYVDGSDYAWQRQRVSPGDRVHIEDFADYETWGNGIGAPGPGKAAQATWRSEGTEQTIPIQVLRSPQIEAIIDAAEGPAATWLAASTAKGCIAWLNKCTHFCCTPGYKTTVQAESEDAGDEVYCQCHQSVYDPYSIVRRRFFAFPRPLG